MQQSTSYRENSNIVRRHVNNETFFEQKDPREFDRLTTKRYDTSQNYWRMGTISTKPVRTSRDFETNSSCYCETACQLRILKKLQTKVIEVFEVF